MRRLLLLLLLLLVPSLASADVVRYVNAVIHGEDATSFTLDGDRRVPAGKADRVVDLAGGYVVFGLTDAHGHLLGLGRAAETIDLRGSASPDELVRRVVAGAPASGWTAGRGWDQNRFADKQFPTHHALSKAFPDRPVVLTRIDGHALLANAEAMRRAGVTAATVAPAGGQIIHHDGAPTGVFVDAAMALIGDHIPPPDDATRRRWLTRAFAQVTAVGLTRVHDMGVDRATLRVLQAMDAAGEVPIRVYAYTDGLLDAIVPARGRRVHVVGVKLFSDGALGSRGASLLEPYSDAGHTHGLLQFDLAGLTQTIRTAHARRLQVAVHAIGDRAVRTALDAFEAAGPGPRPGRIEHAQVVTAQDQPRFAALKIVASMQPTHATSDMPWAEERLGPERIQGAYAWRSLANAGATLVFGSDFPVESPDPRLGLQAAVARHDTEGQPEGGWFPQQRVTLDEALRAFTVTPAQVVGDPTPGADFTVFARDLRTVAPTDLHRVPILRVVVGGVDVGPTVKEKTPER